MLEDERRELNAPSPWGELRCPDRVGVNAAHGEGEKRLVQDWRRSWDTIA